jgi:hypothetical protein
MTNLSVNIEVKTEFSLQECGQNWFEIFNLFLKAKNLFHF